MAVAAVVKGAVVLGGVCMLPYFSEKKGGAGELEWCVCWPIEMTAKVGNTKALLEMPSCGGQNRTRVHCIL